VAQQGSKTRSRKKAVAAPGGAPARPHTWWLIAIIGGLVLVNLYVFLWRKGTSVPEIQAQAKQASITGAAPLVDGASGSAAGSGTDSAGSAATPATPSNVTEGKVEAGDSLGKILKRVGLVGADATEIMRALQPHMDFRAIRAGQTFRLEREPGGKVRAFEFVLSKTERVRVQRNAQGQLVGGADKAATRLETRELGVKIQSSLYAAIKGAGETTALIGQLVDVFAYDLDFYNDQFAGDEVRLIVEKEYLGTEFLRYKRILAAEYKGKVGTFTAIQFAPPSAAGKPAKYFTAKGESLEKTILKSPLKYARVSSKFDRKRMHPVLHREKAHLGIDYAAPTGTPVMAAADGVITTRAPSGGAGNLIVMRHDGGLSTLYMHLSAFAPGIKVGDRVAAKTVIGKVGTTGLSTGPHLHFGVKVNGSYVDPATLTPRRGAGVPVKDLPAFRRAAEGLRARMAAISLTVPSAPEVDDDADQGDGDGPALGADEPPTTSATGGPAAGAVARAPS
jgi:murein DD-endopeptidase MepM/ murein hydrolase activator NlpD